MPIPLNFTGFYHDPIWRAATAKKLQGNQDPMMLPPSLKQSQQQVDEIRKANDAMLSPKSTQDTQKSLNS